jgi:hypothetical protein
MWTTGKTHITGLDHDGNAEGPQRGLRALGQGIVIIAEARGAGASGTPSRRHAASRKAGARESARAGDQ